MTRIIALAGFKRAGKDTAARALVRCGFKRIAFADAVREEAFALYPAAKSTPDAMKEVAQECLGGLSLRDVLIEIGQGRRAQDPMYWVNIAKKKIEAAIAAGNQVVVSDVRMENEITMLREMGALMIWIERPGVVSNGHETEQDHSIVCDVTLSNDGSPEDLERKTIEQLDESRCGRCRHFKSDRTFSRYGYCGAAADQRDKARMLDIGTSCLRAEQFSVVRLTAEAMSML